LRCVDPGRVEAAISVRDQIIRASASNATATRRLAGSSTASSYRACVPPWRDEHVDDLPELVDRAVDVAPPAPNPHIRLVDLPAVTNGVTTRPSSVDQPPREAQHPPAVGHDADDDALLRDRSQLGEGRVQIHVGQARLMHAWATAWSWPPGTVAERAEHTRLGSGDGVAKDPAGRRAGSGEQPPAVHGRTGRRQRAGGSPIGGL